MTSGKWSDDAFLDLLKGHKDDLADLAVSRLIEDHGIQKVGYIFKQMSSNDDQVPADAPRALRDFVEQTRELPPGIDSERLAQHDALLPFGPISCLIMLAASLPHGYSAPRLSRILTISDDLATHPYKRLMGVVQLLINLGSRDAFVPGGRAVVTAQKMRLLHAGVRLLVPKYRPDYHRQFGVPVNFEDQLATLMGFSYLVIEGLRRLHCVTRDKDAEDRYYRWRVFAQLMGIHPPGKPDDEAADAWDRDEHGLHEHPLSRRLLPAPHRHGVDGPGLHLHLPVLDAAPGAAAGGPGGRGRGGGRLVRAPDLEA